MKNKKINVDDTLKIKNIQKVFCCISVSQSTIIVIDQYGKEDIFFIKEVEKILTKQKKLPLEFEEKSNLKQLTLF